jgi:hypothetical protein
VSPAGEPRREAGAEPGLPERPPGAAAAPGSALAPTPSRAALAGPSFFLLGFTTLSVQVVLLRELFSVLYGSDLAFGVALAAWTVLTALGALAAARSGRVPLGVGGWGLSAYGACGIAVFLAVRAWGALEVIPFHSYLLIPLFLAPLCLLGGMLFPWYLAEARAVPPARAYGWEVTGGLAAGVTCAVEFRLGALSCPFVLGLALLAVGWDVGTAARRGYGLALRALPRLPPGWRRGTPAGREPCSRPGADAGSPGLPVPGAGAVRHPAAWMAMVLAGLAVAVLPLSAPGQALERLSLRLRLRQGYIVAVVNTPCASLVAVRDAVGQAAVYENGTPWPLPDYTAARAAVAVVLRALPATCEQAVFIQALRAGFGPVLAVAPWSGSPRFLEADPLAVAFAGQHMGVVETAGRPQPFSLRALQPVPAGWDVVAVLSAGPGGLLANRPLTREFAALVRPRLSAEGVFVIALPAAPGFTHPAQEAYVETVAQALREVFPAFCELRTQVGWTLLVASVAPLDRSAAARRVRERASGVAPEVLAEASAILSGAGAVSLDLLAGTPTMAAPGGREVPANRIRAPRAYFRFLQFRGRMIEDAPAWWRWLFRERVAGSCIAVLAGLLAAGMMSRRGRALQGVFWAAWSATITLVLALYLYQSLAGDAFWAVALLSAASLAGILGGTRLRHGRVADWAAAGLGWIPAALFPLYTWLQHWPGWLALVVLLVLTAAAGICLGQVFARRSAAGTGVAQGGALFAVDLLGAGAGLFLGGVLLPWWSGFEAPALIGSLITFAVLVREACRRGTV